MYKNFCSGISVAVITIILTAFCEGARKAEYGFDQKEDMDGRP
jgi:hypothetical protein